MRLKEIERQYHLDRIHRPSFAKYVRELIGGCRYLIGEVERLNVVVEDWKSDAKNKHRLAYEAQKENEALRKVLEEIAEELTTAI